MMFRFIAVAGAVALFAAACGSGTDDVAMLVDTDADSEDTPAGSDDGVNAAEAAWMAWAQCLRDNGLEVEDPVVDSDGNVEKQEVISDASDADTKEKGDKAGAACDQHLEGVTAGFAGKDGISAEEGDALLALAICLRKEGLDVDDPDMSTENPASAMFGDLKKRWEEPDVVAAREVCDFDAAFGGTDKK